MSTMLKHAAMTVLSKTLQTFLYKYLLEVDVEGVAMPSLLSSDYIDDTNNNDNNINSKIINIMYNCRVHPRQDGKYFGCL